MFKEIFLFELKYRFTRPATYLYFLLLFITPLLIFGFGNTPASEKVFHNSPVIIGDFMVLVSIFGVIIASAVMGVPIYRDLEHRTGTFLFTYPISKFGYFMGRFWGSFVTLVFITFASVLGIYFGSLLGPFLGNDASRFGPNELRFFIHPWLTLLLPNLWLASTLFFALIVFTRNIRSIYAGGILVFIVYLFANTLSQDIENKDLVQLLDPFGLNTLNIQNKYLTPYERNTLLIPIRGNLLFNRIIWFGVGLALFIAGYIRFGFEYFFQIPTSKLQVELKPSTYIARDLRQIKSDFSSGYQWRSFITLARLEIENVFKDVYFKSILLGGVVFLTMNFWKGSSVYGVSDLPYTSFFMEAKSNSFNLFVFIIIVFFSGESLHREKSSGFSKIVDSYPVKDWISLAAKFLGITVMILVLTSIPIGLGIVVQLAKGFFQLDVPVYLIDSYLISFPDYLQVGLIVFGIHLLVNNKFAGHIAAFSVLLINYIVRTSTDFNFNLFFYSYKPPYKWSDMNGIGHFLHTQVWYNLYWTSFGIFLVLFLSIFFSRGAESSLKNRWKTAKSRLGQPAAKLSFLFLALAILIGGFIFRSTVYDNNYLTVEEEKQRRVTYEQELKGYEQLPQPKITKVKIKADLFPYEREAYFEAEVQLVNKSSQSIDSIHFHSNSLTEFKVLLDGKVLPYRFPLTYQPPKFQILGEKPIFPWYQITALPYPLQPGDTLSLVIQTNKKFSGTPNSGFGREVVRNGTFISNVLPFLGYDPTIELESEADRNTYGLPPKLEDLPSHGDPVGESTLLYSPNSDLISFEAVVSTVPNQIAVAPGYLQKEWIKDGRRYFHYIQDTPIQAFFSFVSAEYKVLKDSVKLPDGKLVNLEIFHHPSHTYNLDRFLAAYKDGLAYFSETYGDYQFRQMRLLEYPRYSGFAQSFPNTIPFTESFGWLADFKSPDDFDYVYFVTAHELAHQWWGHQVMPNFTLGSNVISESLAEFSALVLTERRYGKNNMKRFLKEELDNYLSGRAFESKRENTFIHANRPYQFYNKGSLILYGLRDLIGANAMDSALFAFNKEFRLREHPPFPGSNDLYRYLDAVTPDSLKYYLEDTWNKITLYENKAESASVKKLENGDYEITLRVKSQKIYVDESGKESDALYSGDYIDIGVFAQDDLDEKGRNRMNPLYLKKHKVKPGETTIKLRVKGVPIRAGIDPYNLLIDRIPEDNSIALETF
ncbi:ABC transporter permease/M1 family aminopeptidase [Algoriphagus confluentis]|uniref:M1 family aminopeptidase n=1 Tax=Algoriphagus confluentis TaxID=1697556 RepID=A0ABQ6PWY6_9BACT|nr:M1 family aminopeptidase [Algoriphagus confluentis]